jgi:heme/copper-type cytochrome/quinol oxidase subunit 3
MDFLLNVLIWAGVVIFALFFIGFMAAVKLNKRQDSNTDDNKK